MEIREEYIRRYWYQMVEEQVSDDYKSKGYEVSRECFIGDSKTIRADLYATKGDEKIIIEIVTKTKPKAYLLHLYDLAHEMGAELKLVYANYAPITMKNGFEGFELAFTNYLNEIEPSEFGEFATHARVDDIMDAEFTGIYVDGLRIELSGNCTIELMAWFDNDDPEFEYHVPCKFEIEMEYDNKGWGVIEHKKLQIDTSQLN